MKTKRLFAFLLALVMSLGLVLPAFAEGIETDPAENGETAEQAFGDATTLESVNNDPEPHRANLEDGYYLIGPNGWTVGDINDADKLEVNPGNTNEYWIKTTVAVGDTFKIVRVENGSISTWYGSGNNDGDYVISDATPSGSVSVYFQTNWNNDWNGHIYVAQNYDLTIAAATNGTVDASAKQNISVGETVTLTVTPAAGYLLDSLTVDGADVTASVANGKYSFEMTGHDVTVSAQFAKIPYPTAKVVEMTPAKAVPLYDIATQKQIGTVDELEAEYSFTPDNPTPEQIAYYGPWHADYRISFDQDIAKDTFGLYGKYFGYGKNLEAAFQFPTDLKAGEEVYLLGSIGFDGAVNYNDCLNNIQEFLCGVYNLSEDNWGKTISVDLVIWDGSDPDTRIVVSRTDYTFKGKAKLNITEAPELPQANVTAIETETVQINSENVALEAEYKFTPVEPTAIQLAYYGGWRADYRVSMNADTAAESFGLYGAYNGYGQEFKQGFLFPVELKANEPIQLLASAGLSSVTYNDVVNNIGEFICGVFNKSADNVGKTFKVELIIWDENDANAEPAVLVTTTYTFVNQIPPLPKASIEEITENKDTNIPVYNPSTFAETGEVVEELGAEYKFTPDPETTEAQKEYYKDWRCDYRISFNKDIAAESFGLFGAYGDYNVAFLYPEDVNDSTVKYLLRDFGLDAKLTYKEVLNNVQQFKCGAFNLSDDNLNKDKWMKVELVMFAPDQTAEDSVVIATDYYYFGDKTNLVPPLPKASIEEITENKDTNIPVYNPSTFAETGEVVEELGAEYKFTPDPETTEAQKEYYKDWRCDYRISFNKDIVAESFGLFGAYGDYNVAFLYPEDVDDSTVKYLLRDFGLDAKLTYKEVLNNVQQFKCGAFNLSDDNLNKDKWMKVELVMFAPDQTAEDSVVITTDYYYFGDKTNLVGPVPELPEANVKSITPATVEIDGESVVLEAEYEFTPVQPTEAQLNYYGNWYADYRVSMDAATTKETFGLYGEYDGYGTHFAQGFLFPQDLAKDETVQLLEMLDLTGVTYNDVVNNIGKFTCGVFNKSDENLGKTFTVELIIWNPAAPDTKYVIATTKYTFEKPELPEANVKSITPATVEIDGESVVLEAEYEFTPVEPTEAQLAYYGGWYADYRVSMDAATTKETFGLYGEYDGYGTHFAQGFLFPQDLAKDETVQLLEMLDLTGVTYNDVVNNIGKFTCGVFNKSDENLGKTFTVELVIWDPADPDTKYVIATTPYTFRDVHIVTLTSQDTQGNTGITALTGGGQYETGTEITVTAPNVDDYSFIGWYNGSYAAENKVADTYEYTFTVEEDIELIAVYQSKAGTGLLHVIGNTYKVNDGELQTSRNDFDIAIGAKTKLEYLGDDFLYWVNIAGNIVSTDPTYNFVMVGETTIRLITSQNEEENESVYVVFLNAYNQVLSEGRALDVEEVEQYFPKIDPSKIGATFVKWVFQDTEDEATADAIFGKASSTANVVVTVVPLYDTSDAGTYTLNVKYKNGGTTGDVEGYTGLEIVGGNSKTINVSDIAEAAGLSVEDFSFWSFDGETPVSFDATSYMVVAANGETINLVAVFGSDTEPEPTVLIDRMWRAEENGKYKIKTKMSWFVPEGCEVQKCGFVYTTNDQFSTDEKLRLDTGETAVKAHPTGMTIPSGIYTFNGNVGTNADKVLYIRAFVSYTDSEGSVFTIYTDIYSGSYSSLQN